MKRFNTPGRFKQAFEASNVCGVCDCVCVLLTRLCFLRGRTGPTLNRPRRKMKRLTVNQRLSVRAPSGSRTHNSRVLSSTSHRLSLNGVVCDGICNSTHKQAVKTYTTLIELIDGELNTNKYQQRSSKPDN